MVVKKLSAALALALVVVPIAKAQTIDGSTTPIPPSSLQTCEYLFTIGDYKRMAIPHWKRPDAPTQRYKHRKQHYIACADQPQLLLQLNYLEDVYRDRYKEVRLLRHDRDICNRGQQVLACIKYASIVESYSYSTLVSIASCESTLNPRAYNPSGASGLFQFMPSTFDATPYGHKDIWSAKWNSLAAAWKMREHGTSEWACA